MRIPRFFAGSTCAALVAGFLWIAPLPSARAQARVNDKDIQSMMRNVRDDAKSFRGTFDNAAKHSTIRKTSQEKDAKRLVKTFEEQTNHMLNDFKKHHQGGGHLDAVLSTATQIDTLVHNVQFGPLVNAKWEKIVQELEPIANAYNVPTHFMSSGGMD